MRDRGDYQFCAMAQASLAPQSPDTCLLIDQEQDNQQEQKEKQKQKRAQIRQERKRLEETFRELFKEALSVAPATADSLTEFERLLQDERLDQLYKIIDLMKDWDAPTTIPEPKSFLHHSQLQSVLVMMLDDIGKYREYLERFIVRFRAENECISPKYQGSSKVYEQSGPIHYAVQFLQEDFLNWLLTRADTDVNLRNGFKKTALGILCEKYSSKSATVVCPLIERLLAKGADFNICCKDKKLPFAVLKKECDKSQENNSEFLERCNELASGPIALSKVNDRNQHVIVFYKSNKKVQITIELLEIFLRYNDEDNFENYLRQFTITAANVKKVIRLLLHTACEQKLPGCVRLILRAGEKEIFNVVKQPRTGTGRVSARRDQKTASEDGANKELQNRSELEHRVELKGLLKKACEMADLTVLQLLISKISDLLLLNDDPLLVLTLAKANDSRRRFDDRNALLACAEFLANQQTIHVNKRDNSGNTALHLALKHGFDAIALILLRQPYTFLGLRNKDNLTPLDYGSYAFWRSYLDQCIDVRLERSVQNRDVIHFDLNGFDPTPLTRRDGEQQVPGAEAGTVSINASSKPKKSTQGWKLVQSADAECRQERNFTRTVTEMTTLRQISQSKELMRLLAHPILRTFISIKWSRLYHWNYLNLLLTTLTMVFFGCFSLTACSIEGSNNVLRLLSLLCAMLMIVREVMQLTFLGRSYPSFDNFLDLVNVVAMLVVLAYGCMGLVSSFVMISLAMQMTFLLGSLQSSSIATMMYMFKTVSINFLKSFLLFLPLISSFIFAFHLTYNQSPDEVAPVCDKDDCAEENFNNFRTFWNATIKTLVMTTGEFEAAAIDFEGGKLALFMLFMFFAPIVILNLINGLAVSDIAAIREESELISLSKKVMLLEQYERGAANVKFGWLRKFLPQPFFAEHSCHLMIKTRQYRKIMVNPRRTRTKPRDANLPDGKASSARGQDSAENTKFTKITEKPLSKIAWLPSDEACNVVFNLRFLRFPLFMRLDQNTMDEALAIIEKRQSIVSNMSIKSKPAEEQAAKPPAALLGTYQANRRKQNESSQLPEMQQELQDMKTQLETVLDLLRRRVHITRRRKDVPLLAAQTGKKGKRKAHKLQRKKLQKAAREDMGDQ
uniref:Ion transport domain-containing protein n=1 Tax=Anopheles farauti TaxID=69004 RepID=A0A182QR54_9DIPT